jgi:Putative MetA-pathway of phenol degradation
MSIKTSISALFVCGLVLGFPGRVVLAQTELGALSVPRLLVVGADTVPEGKVELTTAWRMGWYARAFDHQGRSQDPELLSTRAVLGVRTIVGLVDTKYFGLEMGSTLPIVLAWSQNRATDENLSAVGLGDIPIGLKMRVYSEREWSLAVGLGVTVPTGDQVAGTGDGNTRFTTGILLSANPVEGLTLDWSTTFGGTAGVSDSELETVATWGLATGVGVAWVSRKGFFRRVTPALEVAWSMHAVPRADHPYQHKLSLNLGLTFQLSRRILMVQGVQFDLAGSNTPRGAMWFMSTSFLI